MPRRKHYPEQIECKVPFERIENGDEVPNIGRNNSNAFSTEDRYLAAKEIKVKWPTQFQDLEAEGDFSRSHYQNVWREYFGPEDTELTFQEIEDEYGSLDAYLEEQEKHEIARKVTKDRSEMTEHELEIYERGVRFGYELKASEEESEE